MRNTALDKDCYLGYDRSQYQYIRMTFNCDSTTGDAFWIEKMPSRTGRDEYAIGYDNCLLYTRKDKNAEFRCGEMMKDSFYIMQEGFFNMDPHPYQIGFLDATRDCPLTYSYSKMEKVVGSTGRYVRKRIGRFDCDVYAPFTSDNYFIRKGKP